MVLLGREEFKEAYDSIRAAAADTGGCTVLVLLAPSPDGMAACRIVCTLLRSDNVSYKIKPVAGYSDIARADEELIQDNPDIRSVIMINCGGPVNLLEFLHLGSHQTCFVVDCHKPVHHANIRASCQVVVMDMDPLNLADVPESADEALQFSDSASDGDSDSGSEAPHGDPLPYGDGGLLPGVEDEDDDAVARRLGFPDDDAVPGAHRSAADDSEAEFGVEANAAAGAHRSAADDSEAELGVEANAAAGDGDGADGDVESDGDDAGDDSDSDGGGAQGPLPVPASPAASGASSADMLPPSPKRRATAGAAPQSPSPVAAFPAPPSLAAAHDSPGRAGAGTGSGAGAGGGGAALSDGHGRKRGRDTPSRPHLLPGEIDRKARIRRYYEGAFVGTPAAYLMYKLAEGTNKDRNDLLWLAIVGVTDHWLQNTIDSDAYADLIVTLRELVRNKNASDLREDDGSVVPAGQNGHIGAVEEYRFILHRHWSLYEAMYHSQYVATRLGTWVDKAGRQRFETMLAQMGVPLKESKERFPHMDARVRNRFRRKLESVGEEYGLEQPCFGSFERQLDYCSPVSASDVVYSVTALLEAPLSLPDAATAPAGSPGGRRDGAGAGAGTGVGVGGEDGGRAGNAQHDDDELALHPCGSEELEQWHDNFWDAYRALSGEHNSVLLDGIHHAIHAQKLLVRLAPELYARRNLWTTGFMRVLRIDDLNDSERVLFTQPMPLARLGRYLIDMHQETKGKWLGARAKPLVLCALDAPKRQYTVVGLPCPEQDDMVSKTAFSVAFQTAAMETQAHYTMDGFESHVLVIRQDDLRRFTEYLQHELAAA